MEEKKSVLSKPSVAYLLSIIVWIGWGSAPPLIKKCYSLFSVSGTASPLVFAGIRYLLASFALFIISTVRNGGFPKISKPDLKKLMLLGTIQTGLAPCFEFIALGYISGTNGSIVNATAPFFLIFFSALFFKDRISLRKIIGIVVGFTGVMLCFVDGGSFSVTFIGEGFVLIQVLFFCLGSMIAKIIATELDPVTTSAFNLLFGGGELLLAGLISGGHLSNGGVLGFALLGVLALISTCCFMMWTSLCTVNDVSKLAPFQFMNPLTGAILSGLILGENVLQLKYVAAILLVCVGTVVATTMSKKRLS